MSKMVPDGWRYQRLSDLAYIDKESLKTSTAPDYLFKYVDIASVSTGKIKIPPEYIRFDESPSRARKRVRNGDVLMSTVRPNLKAFAYFDAHGNDFVASTGFAVIRAKDSNNGKFVLNSILADDITNQIDALIVGSNYPAINSSDVKNLEVLTPPKPEQQKIASILTSVDDMIEKTEAQIGKLQDLKKGMMQELLTKGIGHTEFKDSPVGRIPKGWEAIKISSLVTKGIIDSIQDGNHGELHPKASDYVSDGIPFIMASDLKRGVIDAGNAKKIPESVYTGLRIGFARPGDVLLTHKATIGVTAIVPNDLNKLMLTPQVTYYRIGKTNSLDNHFLYYFFQSPRFQATIARLSAQSTRSYIGITAQKNLYVSLPKDIAEQKAISKIVRSVDNKIRAKQSSFRQLQSLKKALMQDLLTGKVRVKVN